MKRREQKTVDPWATIKADLRHRRRLTYGFSDSAIPSIFAIEAHHKNLPEPIGIVWYRFMRKGSMIETLQSFVMEGVRRCGVRTFLHEKLLEAYPTVQTVMTESGTKSGLAWLKAVGFKQVKDQCWEYTRKTK